MVHDRSPRCAGAPQELSNAVAQRLVRSAQNWPGWTGNRMKPHLAGRESWLRSPQNSPVSWPLSARQVANHFFSPGIKPLAKTPITSVLDHLLHFELVISSARMRRACHATLKIGSLLLTPIAAVGPGTAAELKIRGAGTSSHRRRSTEALARA
jgi:hypothetical protein